MYLHKPLFLQNKSMPMAKNYKLKPEQGFHFKKFIWTPEIQRPGSARMQYDEQGSHLLRDKILKEKM